MKKTRSYYQLAECASYASARWIFVHINSIEDLTVEELDYKLKAVILEALMDWPPASPEPVRPKARK